MNAVRLTLLIVLSVAMPGLVSAATVNLTPTKDTSIFDGTTFANNSAGAQTRIYVGSNNNSPFPPRRGLLEFDLTSIPAGAFITGASLTLTLDSGGNTSSPTIAVHRVNTEWGEGSVSTGGGNGAAANAGDATWNSSQHTISTWTTPGGDYNATASATQTVAGNTQFSTFTWDSSTNPALLADVQAWFLDAASNHGWELINSLEGNNQSVKGFFSREATAANRPSLSITYVPEPAMLSLVAGAAPIVLACRRRKQLAA